MARKDYKPRRDFGRMLKVWCTPAVLVLVGLAGCSGDAPPAPAVDDVDLGDGNVVAAGMAILQGTVFSDAGLTVPDARVFLPGTGFDAATAADGRFRFENVSAGGHTLRVEADGFQVHERDVTLQPASVLDVNVTLLPSAQLGGGYRPHVHDYWRGQSEVTLLDAELDLTKMRVGTTMADASEEFNYFSAAVLYANKRFPKYLIPLPETEDTPALVYPGTKEVQVTFTWNDAPPMPPEYALAYAPANDNSETELERQTSGGTWTIPVTPEMTDNGHQIYTLWEFYIVPVNEVTEAPDYRPSFVTEPIHVTIKVIRGDEPFPEPPHPTFWAGSDTYWVRTFDNGTYSSTGTGVFVSDPKFQPAKERIVPPGTGRLSVVLKWTFDHPTPLAPKYDLYYHGASVSPAWQGPVADWPKATLVEEGDSQRVFEIEVAPGETDGYYQSKSGWRFAARPEGHSPDERTPDQNMARRITIQIDAHRDAQSGSL